jgi:hypothetical protein
MVLLYDSWQFEADGPDQDKRLIKADARRVIKHKGLPRYRQQK